MKLATSRITAQGQISVPLEVRKKLGLTPGSTIEWDAEGDKVVVKRLGKYTFEDAHKALFPDGPPKPRTLEELKAGIAGYIRAKHARR
jgi:AbrB family looped-hinge helix DNA binding protein